MKLALACLTFWLASLFATAGHAHTNGTTGYAAITVEGATIRYALTLPLDALPRGLDDVDGLPTRVAEYVTLATDGGACAPVPQPASPPMPGRENVEIVVLYACPEAPGELRVSDRLGAALGEGHHTIADVVWPGGRTQIVFESEAPTATVAVGPGAAAQPTEVGTGSVFPTYLLLGVEHIVLGFDHVLFVLALILGGGGLRAILLIVTAFTAAHSVTLALSVLGVFSIPGWIVEPMIALSIAFVAAENLFRRGRSLSHRWGIGFLFGLLHGFGFAGALKDVGLPTEGLIWPLVGFNLGVEAGQAAIVALMLPALAWLGRFTWRGAALRAASAGIMAVGVVLLVERTLV